MVRQLSHIWKQMNPEGSDDIDKGSKSTSSFDSSHSKLKSKPKSIHKSSRSYDKSSYRNVKQHNIGNESTEKDSSSEDECDVETKYITKSTDFPLFEKIEIYIKQDQNLYLSILRYEV